MANNFIGKLIDGRYQIVGRVGSGGSACVYRANDVLMRRTVALKILDDDTTGAQINSRCFENEVDAISKLSHPNIVTIYDVSMRNSTKYIVMEFVDGITLRDYLNFHTALRYEEIFSCTKQILAALDVAHAKGIVHRDIKPQNVMILKSGQVKVADFGIARLPHTDNFQLGDRTVGTVHYISPEQASGGAIDAQSDLYSLGILMYEMVTGSRPFEAADISTVASMQISKEPAPPHILRETIPPALEQVILRAMRKNPNERYESAEAMLRALVRAEKHPSKTFSDDVVDAVSKSMPTEKRGLFRRLFGKRIEKTEKTEEAAPVIDGTDTYDRIEFTEEDEMKVILDRDRLARKSYVKNAKEDQAAETDIMSETVDNEEATRVISTTAPETDMQAPIGEMTEKIEESAEQREDAATDALAEEEIALDEVRDNEDEAYQENDEVGETFEEENQTDELDIPDFLRERLNQSAVTQEEPTAPSIDTADTVLFSVVNPSVQEEDMAEEISAVEEEIFEDAPSEEIVEEPIDFLEDEEKIEDDLTAAENQSEGDNDCMQESIAVEHKNGIFEERERLLNEKEAELAERLAAVQEREAAIDARLSEQNEEDLLLIESLKAKLAEESAQNLENEAEIKELEDQIAALKEGAIEANVTAAELRDLKAKLMEAEDAAEEAANYAAELDKAYAEQVEKGRKLPLLYKILFPAVSAALVAGICLSLWFGGILFGMRIPSINEYHGEKTVQGITVNVTYVSSPAPVGTVLRQYPSAGFTRDDVDTIYLQVSAGNEAYSIYQNHKDELDRNLTGNADRAIAWLENVEKNNPTHPNRVQKIYKYDDTVAAGEIICYELYPVTVDGETVIVLHVSQGAKLGE